MGGRKSKRQHRGGEDIEGAPVQPNIDDKEEGGIEAAVPVPARTSLGRGTKTPAEPAALDNSEVEEIPEEMVPGPSSRAGSKGKGKGSGNQPASGGRKKAASRRPGKGKKKGKKQNDVPQEDSEAGEDPEDPPSDPDSSDHGWTSDHEPGDGPVSTFSIRRILGERRRGNVVEY